MTEEVSTPEAEASTPEPEGQPEEAVSAPDEGNPVEPQDASEGTSLDEFDLNGVPENADREWFGKTYKGLQADYTRKTQQLAQERQQVQTVIEAIRDPEHPAHEEVLEHLGLDPHSLEANDDVDDEPDLYSRLEKLEQRLQAEEEAKESNAAEEAMFNEMASQIEHAQNVEGREFSEQELDLIATYAAANTDQFGKPNVPAAIENLKAIISAQQREWVNGKQAPRTPGNGSPAQREVDLSSRDARVDVGTQVAEAIMAAQNPS